MKEINSQLILQGFWGRETEGTGQVENGRCNAEVRWARGQGRKDNINFSISRHHHIHNLNAPHNDIYFCKWGTNLFKVAVCMVDKKNKTLSLCDSKSLIPCHSLSLGLRCQVHPFQGLSRANFGCAAFPVPCEVAHCDLCAQPLSQTHKHCPSVENKVQVLLSTSQEVCGKQFYFICFQCFFKKNR